MYDADGVINNAFMAFSVLLDTKYGLSLDKTKDFFKGPFVDCLVGAKDMKEVLPDYLKKWGWDDTLERFLHLWFTSEHSIEAAIIEDVKELRKKGIECYVATNNEKHRANYMLEQMGFRDHFDGLFASAHLGRKKPDKEFFEKILTKLHVAPEEVLFWDDAEENVQAAQELGIHAEHFSSVKSYRKVMAEVYGL